MRVSLKMNSRSFRVVVIKHSIVLIQGTRCGTLLTVEIGVMKFTRVGESDCHANMIWLPELGAWVFSSLRPIPVTGNRKIARTESIDSVTWTKSETIIEGPLKISFTTWSFRDGGLYLDCCCMNYPQQYKGVSNT